MDAIDKIKEFVILVDKAGNYTGSEEKMSAHKKGLLHKAFSIFIFDEDNRILLQKRANTKYHFAGLWSNACCSHPRVGETTEDAVHRRLQEELGFDTPLVFAFSFVYRAEDTVSGLFEYEYDEVFTGIYNDKINFQPDEVEDIQWMTLKDLDQKIRTSPEEFTIWFKQAYNKLKTFNKR